MHSTRIETRQVCKVQPLLDLVTQSEEAKLHEWDGGKVTGCSTSLIKQLRQRVSLLETRHVAYSRDIRADSLGTVSNNSSHRAYGLKATVQAARSCPLKRQGHEEGGVNIQFLRHFGSLGSKASYK